MANYRLTYHEPYIHVCEGMHVSYEEWTTKVYDFEEDSDEKALTTVATFLSHGGLRHRDKVLTRKPISLVITVMEWQQ